MPSSLAGTLDQQRLADPKAVLAHAQQLLKRCHIDALEVLAVQEGPGCDAILYRRKDGQPRTAWVRRHPDRRIEIDTEPGFPAEPGYTTPAYSGYLAEHAQTGRPSHPDEPDGA